MPDLVAWEGMGGHERGVWTAPHCRDHQLQVPSIPKHIGKAAWPTQVTLIARHGRMHCTLCIVLCVFVQRKATGTRDERVPEPV